MFKLGELSVMWWFYEVENVFKGMSNLDSFNHRRLGNTANYKYNPVFDSAVFSSTRVPHRLLIGLSLEKENKARSA